VRRVPFRLTRPAPETLRGLLTDAASDDLTYTTVGMTAGDTTPDGFERTHWSVELGSGATCFERAATALATWELHRRCGMVVLADGPAAEGREVAISAKLPLFHLDATCRVVATLDEPDRRGFTYGTLSVHPECGEEAFAVVRRPDGTVVFEIDAVSRPRLVLARLAPPIARFVQHRETRRYLSSMAAIASQPLP
jgi:uncharacterized protein (UPF0548 family)